MTAACSAPVFAEAERHPCCVLHGADCDDCPACAESRKAEREWLRISRVCEGCGRRARIVGPRCEPCQRRAAEAAP